MTIRGCLLFALIAGVAGAFIGWVSMRDAPGAQAFPSASSPRSTAAPPGRDCREERADLASTKAKLDICMTLRARVPEAESSDIVEPSEADSPESQPFDQRMSKVEEIRRNRRLLDSYSEAVIVQHDDGRTGVYKPDEWPDDGDGYIVARKLPSGRLGVYAGPDAGPRTDPDAFRPWDPPIPPRPVWNREPDGTITINGKPASPGVQFMFGGKID